MPVQASTESPRRTRRGDETRKLLIAAATATLIEQGFAGSSARVIADRAGVNQGLIFYHFDSVVGLLLAALDAVSVARAARYGEAVAGVTSPTHLVDVATSIFEEDLEAGHVAVLVAMMSGAASTPGLGEEVAKRIAPWTAFARDAISRALEGTPMGSVLPVDEVAYAIVALYLGMEMLTELDGDRSPARALFSRAGMLAGLLAAFSGSAPGFPAAEAGS